MDGNELDGLIASCLAEEEAASAGYCTLAAEFDAGGAIVCADTLFGFVMSNAVTRVVCQ